MSDSAVREMGISDARANMTEVIAEVRLLGHPLVLTRREKPQAVLVSVDFYERARKDRAQLQAIQDYLDELATREQKPDVKALRRVITETLDIADRRAAESLAQA